MNFLLFIIVNTIICTFSMWFHKMAFKDNSQIVNMSGCLLVVFKKFFNSDLCCSIYVSLYSFCCNVFVLLFVLILIIFERSLDQFFIFSSNQFSGGLFCQGESMICLSEDYLPFTLIYF